MQESKLSVNYIVLQSHMSSNLKYDIAEKLLQADNNLQPE